jgi:NADP-dependent 3-hydroxy acid dehydrogenase YdfG
LISFKFKISSARKKLILLTGADSQTGHAIISHLVARGAEVRGLATRQISARDIAALGAKNREQP